ncbi:hypothetical protein [Streptomyces sp. NPDC057287]|uniref:hypothetical protein n=1 Tax=Streptomyces sp. NPDC057287 TaxID=3346086 RepID=UPI0036282E31
MEEISEPLSSCLARVKIQNVSAGTRFLVYPVQGGQGVAHSGHHDHGPHSAGLLDAAKENLGPDPYVRITVAGLDRPWTDPRLVKADLLRRAGRLDAAADELRALGTIRTREELCEVLVLQGRADEAIAVHPTVAEQRVAEPKPEPVPLGDNGYSLEPPF